MTRRHVFEASELVPARLDRAFGFFSEPGNLARITPPGLGFALLTRGPLEMRAGLLIDYRIRLRGFPLRWRSLIEAWEPLRRFVDVQVRGPYRLWRHEHRFEADGDRTWIHDRVEYELPLFPLGEVAHPLLVRPDIERIFRFRRDATRRLLGGPDS